MNQCHKFIVQIVELNVFDSVFEMLLWIEFTHIFEVLVVDVFVAEFLELLLHGVVPFFVQELYTFELLDVFLLQFHLVAWLQIEDLGLFVQVVEHAYFILGLALVDVETLVRPVQPEQDFFLGRFAEVAQVAGRDAGFTPSE